MYKTPKISSVQWGRETNIIMQLAITTSKGLQKNSKKGEQR